MNKRVAVFWDFQNVKLRRLGRNQTLLDAIANFAASRGKISTFKVYGSLIGKCQSHFQTYCAQKGARYIPVISTQKNALDEKLVFDCVKETDDSAHPEVVILVAGDKDYRALIRCLNRLRIHVIVLAQTEHGSTALKQAADEFYDISHLFDWPKAA